MQNKFKLNRQKISYYNTKEYHDKNRAIINGMEFTTTYASRGRAKKEYTDKDKPKSPVAKFDLDRITQWLQSPQKYEKELRTLSMYLYDTHPTYKVIVRYIALLPLYNWTLNIDTSTGTKKQIQKNFLKAAQYLNLIVDDFEYKKLSLQAYKKDIYYGYEIESNDGYFILELDNDFCRVSSIEDGVYNFAFNFSYFDSRKEELDTYPLEFQMKHKLYLGNKSLYTWQELDSKNTICIKTNPETRYALPMFSGMFTSIYDLEYYKKLKKDRTRNENYLLLHQKIPMDDKEPNKFLLGLDHASSFHQMASENLPDGIELVTSPMDLTAVKTEKSKNDNDFVMEAMREVYNDGGISQFLFNSDKNTSIGLAKSVNTDEQIAFFLLSQFEKHINRKLKFKFPSLKLKFQFLNMTRFNEEDVQKQYLTLAQNGVPVKFELASSAGLSPLDVLNKVKLENDIFGLHDLFIPLKTSHTMTNEDNEGGRPTKDDDEASDSTVTNRDNDRDDRKVNG